MDPKQMIENILVSPLFLPILIGVVAYLIVDLLISYFLSKSAEEKGYKENSHCFAIAFWLSLPGWIYVASLPDLELRKKRQELIHLLSESNQKTATQFDQLNRRLQTIERKGSAPQRVPSDMEAFSGPENAYEAEKSLTEKRYEELLRQYETAQNEEEFRFLANEFQKLGRFKEAEDLKNSCLVQIEVLEYHSAKIASLSEEKPQPEEEILPEEETIPAEESLYQEAMHILEQASGKRDYADVIHKLSGIRNYRDAEEKIAFCEKRLSELEEEQYEALYRSGLDSLTAKDHKTAFACFSKLPKDYKDAAARLSECEQYLEEQRTAAAKKDRKKAPVLLILLFLLLLGAGGYCIYLYQTGQELPFQSYLPSVGSEKQKIIEQIEVGYENYEKSEDQLVCYYRLTNHSGKELNDVTLDGVALDKEGNELFRTENTLLLPEPIKDGATTELLSFPCDTVKDVYQFVILVSDVNYH